MTIKIIYVKIIMKHLLDIVQKYKESICIICANKHNYHDIIDFSKIIFLKDELLKKNDGFKI